MFIELNFKAHLSKITLTGIPVFEQYRGLTPLKQFQYVRCVKSIVSFFFFFLNLERLVFLSDDQQTLFQGPFCPKTSKEEITIFDQNHVKSIFL